MRGPEGRGEVEVAVSGIAGLLCSVYSLQTIQLYRPMFHFEQQQTL
jgi:hypothetical protein